MPSSSFKANLSQLKLGLHGVKGGDDEEEEEVGRSSPNKGVHNTSPACPSSPDEVNGDMPERPQPSKQKIRAQSAKRPAQQNGHGKPRSDSPLSSRSNAAPHRSMPPKSAPNLRQNGNTKGTAVKSRDRNGARDSADFQPASPCPQRSQGTRTDTAAGGRRGSVRPRRRHPASHTEEQSCSSGDPQSPRLSVSEQQQSSPNGTLSTDGSDDVKRPSVSGGSGAVRGAGHVSSIPSAWDAFEEHVRTIHDSSDMFSRYQGPSFHASSIFQKTMTHLYGYPDYSRPPGASVKKIASRGMLVAGAANRFLKLRKKTTLTGVGMSKARVKEREVDRQTIENAKRGWRILKQYVHENYTSKRTSQAALSWSMLRHTLKGMSDKEKTRMDLYRRYGIVPSLDENGDLVSVNTMLSERARQAIASGARYPLLVHTTKTLPNDKAPSLPTLTAAGSSSSLLSPRSPAESSGDQHRARSSGFRSARSEVRTSVSGTRLGSGGGGGGMPLRNGSLRKSSELTARTPNRSHTP